MARLKVAIPERSYPVVIGQGALAELPQLIRDLGVSKVAIITDSNIAQNWLEVVETALSGGGIAAPVHVLPAGEDSKSNDELQRVLDFLSANQIDRRGLVLAMGGGVVGDLAGFAAAIWLRGIRYLQLPTTLLAMVDSSIGGKTGINRPEAKNSVGAIWQPIAVVEDLAFLQTLPEEKLISGFAEVLKYGLSMDAELVNRLEADRDKLFQRDPTALEPIISRCVELKGEVVVADEREAGFRQIVNYGHTVGHAMEVVSGYTIIHGRAVAQGMRVAARLGVAMGLCPEHVIGRHESLLAKYDLPGKLPQIATQAIIAALPRDKKAVNGEVGWVLPREVGRVQLGVSVPRPLVEAAVEEVWAQ